MKKFTLLLFLFFSFSINALAESTCSYSEQAELLNKATNVKASYEINTEKVKFVDMETDVDYFNITITNVTDEFYVVISNDYNSSKKTLYDFEAENGLLNYKWNNIDKVTNFTIEVYASGKTNCAGEKYKTLYVQTPRFNEYYDREICEDLTDFYLCQKYITSSLITEDKFFEQIASYEAGKIDKKGEDIDTRNIFDKAFDFIKDNKWYILGGIVVITGGTVYIIKRKNKKSRELGL